MVSTLVVEFFYGIIHNKLCPVVLVAAAASKTYTSPGVNPAGGAPALVTNKPPLGCTPFIFATFILIVFGLAATAPLPNAIDPGA